MESGSSVTSSPKRTTEFEGPHHQADDEPPDYIPFILQTMAAKGLHLRELALKSGINRSRLGLLLHSDPSRRPRPLFIEIQLIVKALGVSHMQAVISVETLRDLSLLLDERFATVLTMLSQVYNEMPDRLIAALSEIDGVDGTEIRRQWAEPLREAVIQKLISEVTKLIARRDVLTEIKSLGL